MLREQISIKQEESSEWELKYINLYNNYRREEEIIKQQQQKYPIHYL